MTAHTQFRTNDQRDDASALRWLKSRLEWEDLLSALRASTGTRPPEVAPGEREPAAA